MKAIFPSSETLSIIGLILGSDENLIFSDKNPNFPAITTSFSSPYANSALNILIPSSISIGVTPKDSNTFRVDPFVAIPISFQADQSMTIAFLFLE